MLYQFVEYQRALLHPLTMWAAGAAHAFADADSPLAWLPGAPYLAAGYEFLYRLGKANEKPEFNIGAVEQEGRTIPVVEKTLLDRPFCRLRRFAPEVAAVGGVAGREERPAVLLCAPLAGHHAVMLREAVTTLLPDHEVYVTDWTDARRVPLADGPFDLDEDVALVQACIRQIGTDRLHVLAICQATVPALAAISLMASAGEPTPRSLIMMGGPIDARRSPTGLNKLAARRPLAWFQQNLIHAVPAPYPGAGRKVYPSFLQVADLVAAQPDHLVGSHWDHYFNLIRGDVPRAEVQRRVCDAYNAVLDMAAEFYLDTVRIVFQEFRLARGSWRVRDQPVRPQDIHTTALLTIEGELDDITGRGQTQAAHDLCHGIAACHKRHVTVHQCGHYDLFSGPRWRTEIYPIVRDQIRWLTRTPRP
ncbi:polyhydroxyalkanoate depolymerase [Cupriavidus sp. IDO]|uniref:polyhydroxyalkanoate depolymerase n=1 Tax=Cupriavidus sp. IDO TaxID=1539142 RepID=UPI00057903EE|nr:polyhydroxyalkanoate depolymerase [Cupriavidus sp. IDO]KWR88061.1 esterase [Cupriavidus sp. IDO]